MSYTKATIDKINADITNHFPHLYPIEDNFQLIHYGVSRDWSCWTDMPKKTVLLKH